VHAAPKRLGIKENAVIVFLEPNHGENDDVFPLKPRRLKVFPYFFWQHFDVHGQRMVTRMVRQKLDQQSGVNGDELLFRELEKFGLALNFMG
jgi:hypothetical protein